MLADEWEPLLPEPDENGNYPALEYARASLARKLIRARHRACLTQVELARLALPAGEPRVVPLGP